MYSLPSIAGVCLPTRGYSGHLIFPVVMRDFLGWVQDVSRTRGMAGSLGFQNQWGHGSKMLKIENWNPIENFYGKNTSNATK